MLIVLRKWFVAVSTWFRKPEQSEFLESWRPGLIGLAVVGIFLHSVSRLWPYVRFGPLGFGYDTGIYRHLIEGYWTKRGGDLPNFGFTDITNVFKWLGFSTDTILIGGYVASSFLLGWAVYLVLKNHVSRLAGLWGLICLSLSFTQIEFYFWFYYRNLLAAALVMVSAAIWKKQPWWAGVCLGLVGVIHPISVVPIGLVFGCLILGGRDQRITLFKIAIPAIIITVGLNWGEWLRYVEPWLQYRGLATNAQVLSPEFSGQFISVGQWVQWSWIWFVLAVPGFWLARSRLWPVWGLGIVACIGVSVQVLFYRRLIVWLDLAILLAAAVTLARLWVLSRWAKCLIVISFAVLVSVVFVRVWERTPAMSTFDWLSLQQLQSLPTQSFVLTVSPQYAPWLYGYTQQRIIAPGMLDENRWNREQWQTFWFTTSSTERASLMAQYQTSTIYIFLAQNQSFFAPLFASDPHFTPVTSQIWQFNLNNYPQVISE